VCWRKAILRKKREKVRMLLEQKLFIVDDNFRSVLLKHRNNCIQMKKLRVFDGSLSAHMCFSLEEFKEKQKTIRNSA
jgi:hypothetical protein